MAIRKLHFILGFLVLAATAQAQISTNGGTDWKDSSLIPPSRMAQHKEFLNNQYTFPAKPRSQWELGIKVGSPTINGDISANFPSFGYGLHVRNLLVIWFLSGPSTPMGLQQVLAGRIITIT